ncbi:MAG: DUF1849 family protein [Alphaproteobacteria bacterium]|nr:DUF1849 family protein [Alphaproteobacteria bacterium]
MRLFSFVFIILAAVSFTDRDAHSDEIKTRVDALGFKPHKALYDIRMIGARSGSQILNISGQMFYEWQPVCDAWISNHRFNLLYEYADSAPMRITSSFSTYESFDGQSLNYTSQRKRHGQIFEELRGNAAMPVSGGMGSAMFTIPSDLEFELPDGTLFPIAHSIEVAERMKKGEKFYSATLFDGSDEEGPVSVNAFIGKEVTPDQAKLDYSALDKDLISSPAHNVRLAFFPLNNNEATSDYEMTLVYHQNSLISDMLIEYDDFTVSQKLVAVEPVEDGCQSAGETPEIIDE